MDIDPDFNIIAGGKTDDSGVATQVLTSPVPIAAFFKSGGFIRWAVSFYNSVSDYATASAIKISPDNKLVAVSIESSDFRLDWTIVILNAINGTSYKNLIAESVYGSK